MKKWLEFLSEQRWRNGWDTGAQNVGNSQVTSPQSMISTDQDKTKTWPMKPPPDFEHSRKKPDLNDKVNWLSTMVDLINAKRLQQMELNTRIMTRLGRLEKVAKLPPELKNGNGSRNNGDGNGNGNGVTW